MGTKETQRGIAPAATSSRRQQAAARWQEERRIWVSKREKKGWEKMGQMGFEPRAMIWTSRGRRAGGRRGSRGDGGGVLKPTIQTVLALDRALKP